MKPIVLRSVLFGASAVALLAQPPQPPQSAQPPQAQDGGWRRFDDAAPAGSAQVAPAPLPPQGQYSNAPAAPFAPPPAQITVPTGTWLTIRVNQPLSTDHNREGDAFTATLVQPVIAQGIVVARRGQTLGGRVSQSLKAGRVKGTSQLAVELTDLSLVDGQHVPLKTELVQYSGGSSVGRDVAAVGTTTGVGAAVGAIADGGVGAGIGAGAGAAASLIGVLVTRGRPTVIVPEETLTFRTAAPMTFSTESAPQAFQPATQRDYESGPSFRGRGPVAGAPGPYPYAYAPYPYYGYGYGPYYGPGYYGPGVVFYGRGHRW